MPRFNLSFLISALQRLLLNFPSPIWPQRVESNLEKDEIATSTENKTNTESSSGHVTKQIPKEPEKIDPVGEKVGQEIDDFSQKASSQIGAWINTKAFYGITWLKLILSLLMLFVVLLIERIVSLTIDRRRRRIKEEKEVKPMRHLILESVAKPLSLFIWIHF